MLDLSCEFCGKKEIKKTAYYYICGNCGHTYYENDIKKLEQNQGIVENPNQRQGDSPKAKAKEAHKKSGLILDFDTKTLKGRIASPECSQEVLFNSDGIVESLADITILYTKGKPVHFNVVFRGNDFYAKDIELMNDEDSTSFMNYIAAQKNKQKQTVNPTIAPRKVSSVTTNTPSKSSAPTKVTPKTNSKSTATSCATTNNKSTPKREHSPVSYSDFYDRAKIDAYILILLIISTVAIGFCTSYVKDVTSVNAPSGMFGLLCILIVLNLAFIPVAKKFSGIVYVILNIWILLMFGSWIALYDKDSSIAHFFGVISIFAFVGWPFISFLSDLMRSPTERIEYDKNQKLQKAKELEQERFIAEQSQRSSSPWGVKYFTSPCPYCGHYKARYAKWDDKKISVAFWGVWSSKVGKPYICDHCKTTWG